MTHRKNFFRYGFSIICSVVLYAIPFSLQAQERCGNEIFQQVLDRDPVYKADVEAVNQAVYEASKLQSSDDNTIYEIPIAIHVIHLGEPVGTGSNISDQQILDAVQGANERWRKVTGSGVDMRVQFCLAQTDPDGNPSIGIDRVDASSVPNYPEYGISYVGALGEPGASETKIKNLSNWPHTYVYNIWVVWRIAGDWGGYAFFPGSSNYPTDGVIITSGSIRYTSSTLAHELGHGMGLFHTFQGDYNGCPPNGNCANQGDWVCDTPPNRQEECSGYHCSSDPDSILALTFKNYMSYCSGRDLFTEGQKTRSRSMINTTTRKLLLHSTACSVSTGIGSEHLASTVHLYPNPTHGTFTLEMEVADKEATYLDIINMLGQTVAHQTLSSGNRHIISMENTLPKGIYQVHVMKEGQTLGVAPISIY